MKLMMAMQLIAVAMAMKLIVTMAMKLIAMMAMLCMCMSVDSAAMGAILVTPSYYHRPYKYYVCA